MIANEITKEVFSILFNYLFCFKGNYSKVVIFKMHFQSYCVLTSSRLYDFCKKIITIIVKNFVCIVPNLTNKG